MKKLDNFTKCLNKLKTADFTKDDEFYKAGVITHFTLTFELAWKALQATLRFHGVVEAETGSPREILKLGYKFGYIDNDDVWLTMLRKRNAMSHIYDEDESNETLSLIHSRFIAAFSELERVLREKLSNIEAASPDELADY